jgi:hypothetical protein
MAAQPAKCGRCRNMQRQDYQAENRAVSVPSPYLIFYSSGLSILKTARKNRAWLVLLLEHIRILMSTQSPNFRCIGDCSPSAYVTGCSRGNTTDHRTALWKNESGEPGPTIISSILVSLGALCGAKISEGRGGAGAQWIGAQV